MPAKNSVNDWSIVPVENDNIADFRLLEGEALVAQTNDVVRNLMAQTKQEFGTLDGLFSAAAKEPCRLATTGPITAFGNIVVDGDITVVGDRVVRKNEPDQKLNGIWIANAAAWTRAPDFLTSAQVVKGTRVTVTGGAVNGGKDFKVTSENPIDVGIDDIAFELVLNITPFMGGVIANADDAPEALALLGVTPFMSGLNASADTAVETLQLLGAGASGIAILAATTISEAKSVFGLAAVTPKDYAAIGNVKNAAVGAVPDETAQLQSMLTNAPEFSVIDLMGRAWKATSLTLNKALTFFNGRIILTALAVNTTMFSCTASGQFTSDNVTLEGTGLRSAYVTGAHVFGQVGASAANRASGPRMTNTTVKGAGSVGIYTEFCKDIYLPSVDVSECAYGGVMNLSPDGVYLSGKIDMLNAVGTSGNAYGITNSHDSTNYNADPNAGTPLALKPFAMNVLVEGLKVVGPQLWCGIDAHGGYNVKVLHCSVYACKHGIHTAGGSGAATNFAGWNNKINNNLIDTRLPDGTDAGVVPNYGINANGGSVVSHDDIEIMGNTVIGYGGNAAARPIRVSAYVKKFSVIGNTIDKWDQYAIETSVGALTGVIALNTFGQCSSASGLACINIIGVTPARITVEGNIQEAGGFQPATGLAVSSSITGLVVIGVNAFETIATPYSIPAGTAHGPGWAGNKNFTGVSGAYTPDASMAAVALGVPLTLLFSGLAGAVTISDITAPLNALILLRNEDATNNVTFDRTNAALSGAVNAVLGRYDTLLLQKVANSGVKWRSLGPVVANG